MEDKSHEQYRRCERNVITDVRFGSTTEDIVGSDTQAKSSEKPTPCLVASPSMAVHAPDAKIDASIKQSSESAWIAGVDVVPVRRWTSPRTGATYPVSMTVRTGTVTWQIEPLMDDQELDNGP